MVDAAPRPTFSKYRGAPRWWRESREHRREPVDSEWIFRVEMLLYWSNWGLIAEDAEWLAEAEAFFSLYIDAHIPFLLKVKTESPQYMHWQAEQPGTIFFYFIFSTRRPLEKSCPAPSRTKHTQWGQKKVSMNSSLDPSNGCGPRLGEVLDGWRTE